MHRILWLMLLNCGLLAHAQHLQSVLSSKLRPYGGEWTTTTDYTQKNNGIRHVYAKQLVNGIPVFNGVAGFTFKNEVLVHSAIRFANLNQFKLSGDFLLNPEEILRRILQSYKLTLSEIPKVNYQGTDTVIFMVNGLFKKPISVSKTWVKKEEELRAAYHVLFSPANTSDNWSIRIDASNGTLIHKNNRTLYCNFVDEDLAQSCEATHPVTADPTQMMASGASYRVFPFPTEAPTFGNQQLVTTNGDPNASPFGWHDNDGVSGPEFTNTYGNNVWAYEDSLNMDAPGYSPDGGPGLSFDFPFNPVLSPEQNLDASITNLFYVNNVVHDVLHRHGFDEQAGNFQFNNYGNGGSEFDHVNAEALDGSGVNNANFYTPEDGQNPWMQMFRWNSNSLTPAVLRILSPSTIAADYDAVEGAICPEIVTPITAEVILVNDDTDPASDGCEFLLNGEALAGKIALIDRGLCTFVEKIQQAEAYGAVAVIMINNNNSNPIVMGGSEWVGIPAVMISKNNGELLKQQLGAGESVQATLLPHQGDFPDFDSSLDNGIIAHEYGHGLSNRLTGGPFQVDCLWHEEQGGEGWSDFLSLLFTIKPGDNGSLSRGIGTYASGQSTTGGGIRRYPYSTDVGVNPQTYGMVANSTGPHAIGEIWCMAIWEMTWKLIENEGFDPDWYNGTSGNNIALRLVIEGMKLQPCEPGYMDARDAILAADELLYGGQYQCLIWQAFAKRGFGVNADQGSTNFAGDESEDFEFPPDCIGVGMVDPKSNETIRLFPNPTHNLLQLHSNEPIRFLEIYNAAGTCVLRQVQPPYMERNQLLSVETLSPGLYTVLVIGDHSSVKATFVKTNE